MTPARRRQLAQARQEAAGNPPAALFVEPVSERLTQGALEHYEAHAARPYLDPPFELSPTQLDQAQAYAESLPAVPFIAPKKRRRRRKKSASDAPRKPGRPALGEAGPAARVSVSLAPETMAAVRLAARRRKVKLGTVLRELAEAWASRS